MEDLKQEMKRLVGLFSHLRDSFDEDDMLMSFIMATDSGRLKAKSGGRRRQRMSAAAKGGRWSYGKVLGLETEDNKDVTRQPGRSPPCSLKTSLLQPACETSDQQKGSDR